MRATAVAFVAFLFVLSACEGVGTAEAIADGFESRAAGAGAVDPCDPVPVQHWAARRATTRFASADAESAVERLYRAILGRPADPAGLDAYRPHLERGRLDIVVGALATSDEFRDRTPTPSITQLAESLYAGILERPSDPGGLAATEDAIAGGYLAERAAAMVLSTEYAGRRATPPDSDWRLPSDRCAAPTSQPRAARTGLVRLAGRSLVDDQGPFNALGATMFWAAWAYKFDRPKLEAALDLLSQNGFDYFRALGVVGDPNRADYWDGREISWRWSDYKDVIAGLTDLAYDQYGLRVEWTLIGDGQVAIPNTGDRYRLADWFLEMSRGREAKIVHFEIANESWQNGFGGSQGLTDLRALTRYMKDRTEILVAASAPANSDDCAEVQAVYGGGVADLATIHFSRDVRKTEGPWRPVRQPWGLADCSGIPVGSNNEPIGPGSSVASETDPVRLVAASIATYVANLPLYVFHSRAGVRGDLQFADMSGVTSFGPMKGIVPGDLASWSRKNCHWGDAPFRCYAIDGAGNLVADRMWPDIAGATGGAVRAYAGVNGGEFFAFPFGIRNRMVMEPRRDAEFDVIDPMTGATLDHKVLRAGEKFELSGAAMFVLRGRYR